MALVAFLSSICITATIGVGVYLLTKTYDFYKYGWFVGPFATVASVFYSFKWTMYGLSIVSVLSALAIVAGLVFFVSMKSKRGNTIPTHSVDNRQNVKSGPQNTHQNAHQE